MSLTAFVACSFPPHLSARGKPRDLRDLSPIPTDSRLYCAPLHGAPDDPSSQYRSSRLRRPSARDASAGSRSPSPPSPMAVSSQHWMNEEGIVLVQTARLRMDGPSNQYRAKWRSVHLGMNEMENACDKHDHCNAQQGNGEPLDGASRCPFGRWLAHASFLVLCLAPPT